jgi:hypothetical protein
MTWQPTSTSLHWPCGSSNALLSLALIGNANVQSRPTPRASTPVA